MNIPETQDAERLNRILNAVLEEYMEVFKVNIYTNTLRLKHKTDNFDYRIDIKYPEKQLSTCTLYIESADIHLNMTFLIDVYNLDLAKELAFGKVIKDILIDTEEG